MSECANGSVIRSFVSADALHRFEFSFISPSRSSASSFIRRGPINTRPAFYTTAASSSASSGGRKAVKVFLLRLLLLLLLMAVLYREEDTLVAAAILL